MGKALRACAPFDARLAKIRINFAPKAALALPIALPKGAHYPRGFTRDRHKTAAHIG